jgi:hypothetical protein
MIWQEEMKTSFNVKLFQELGTTTLKVNNPQWCRYSGNSKSEERFPGIFAP